MGERRIQRYEMAEEKEERGQGMKIRNRSFPVDLNWLYFSDHDVQK
jgi:hypothetical protein